MRIDFKIKGMHCRSCEKLIENTIKKIEGVKKVEVNYEIEKGKVEFDSNKTNSEEIFKIINLKGYDCRFIEEESGCYTFKLKSLGIIFGVIGLVVTEQIL